MSLPTLSSGLLWINFLLEFGQASKAVWHIRLSYE